MNSEIIKVGGLILLHNNKRKDKKAGSFSFACLGPYIISEITPKRVTTLKKRDGETQKVKCNSSQLKLCVEEKTADAGGDTTDFFVAVDNANPSTSVNIGTNTPLKNTYWESLPNELIEKVLLCKIKESGLQTCQIYQTNYPNVQKVRLRYVTFRYVTLHYLCSLK